MRQRLAARAEAYLKALCGVKPNRRTGSPGNRKATEFFARTMGQWGFRLATTPFPCLDHRIGRVSFTCRDSTFEVQISPYSLGCDITAELVMASTVGELEKCACAGKLLLLKGALCAEQLMPKNFVFYNPDHHKAIYALLEEKKPAAIIGATGRNPELAGGLYPHPLIEDGDFDIPSVFCTDVEGEKIAVLSGRMFRLKSDARRIPTNACNVVARKNPGAGTKIIVCAHIDAKETTPGALDNAAGTIVLLLLAEMLKGYEGKMGVEIVALNGEDNYTAGGEMDYLRRYGDELKTAVVGINIDGVGFREGNTAYSFYECPAALRERAVASFGGHPGLAEGKAWPQSDHMIFVQNGRSAIAFTSRTLQELMVNITHTSADVPGLVDCGKLVEVAEAIRDLILTLGSEGLRGAARGGDDLSPPAGQARRGGRWGRSRGG